MWVCISGLGGGRGILLHRYLWKRECLDQDPKCRIVFVVTHFFFLSCPRISIDQKCGGQRGVFVIAMCRPFPALPPHPPLMTGPKNSACIFLFFLHPSWAIPTPLLQLKLLPSAVFSPLLFLFCFSNVQFFLFFFLRCSLFVPLCCWPDELRAMHEGGTWDAGERQHRKKKKMLRSKILVVGRVCPLLSLRRPLFGWRTSKLRGYTKKKNRISRSSLHSGVEGEKKNGTKSGTDFSYVLYYYHQDPEERRRLNQYSKYLCSACDKSDIIFQNAKWGMIFALPFNEFEAQK